MTPVFIFSLPRSGSTLLQRILTAHRTVDSCAEPWVLLPAFYGRRRGPIAEYGHTIAARGISNTITNLDGGVQDYAHAVRAFAHTLYTRLAAEGTTHFLDKTPRYHLIVDDILQAFPEGRFIFLWRNPMAIVSSIMQTWQQGRWNLDRFRVDLYKGLPNLISACRRESDRVHMVQYESLVEAPAVTMEQICDYVGIDGAQRLVETFNHVQFAGDLGDPTGTEAYSVIQSATTEKWKATLSNTLRKRWMHNYLHWLGERRLHTMGYDLDALCASLEQTPTNTRFLASDLYYRARSLFRPWIHPAAQRDNVQRLQNGERLFERS